MKYVFMFSSRPDLLTAVPQERQDEVYQQIFAWFEDHYAAGRVVDGGAELQPVSTATTVKSRDDGEVVVVDGPFTEAKEVVGGFTIVDLPDLDAAIALAKSWPSLEFPGIAIEIRPVVTYE